MGGNTTIKTKSGELVSAERIPIKDIGRDNFVKSFQTFLLNINKEFKSVYGYYIWEDKNEIMNGGIFNGSTSFIMSPNFKTSDIEKFKPHAGDLDVAIPREIGQEVFDFLEDREGKEFSPGIKYIGNNANTRDKLGNTLICIAKAQFGDIIVQAQLDLELSDMESGKQTDWSAFAHSSSFEDTKEGMKGVANKYFWRALVGAVHQLDKGFVVATPSSTADKVSLKGKQPSKIRLLNFGVDSGVGAGYEILTKDGEEIKIDGKTVYREKKPQEKTYDKDLANLISTVFGDVEVQVKDTHSFIKILELSNKYLSKKEKQEALDRFLAILFCTDGGQCQAIEPNDYKEDVKIKSAIYLKAVQLLKLKEANNLEDMIKQYVQKTHKINESFRNLIGWQ
jgi:hypothetical protein